MQVENYFNNVNVIMLFFQWHKLKPKEVISRLREILAVFSAQLENKKYLFGNRISEVDCLLFGHLYSILTTEYFSVLGPKYVIQLFFIKYSH